MAGAVIAQWVSNALRLLVPVVALVGLLLAPGAAQAQSGFGQNPVLFVHGIEGSGAQFESQKMRFMSNGYPERWIDAVDYDSTRAVADKSEVHSQIDQAIAELKQRAGRSKVDVVGHSLGTTVMHDYFTRGPSTAQRKANVGRYINVDGQSSNPGVPTLAVWAGRGTPGRKMDGAENVTVPNQTHVEVATSAQSFVEYHKFLTGKAPVHDLVPQTGQVTVAGRALLFPQNKALPGVVVEVWPVSAATGQREGSSPVARIALGGDGNFGPVRVDTGRHYEFVVLRPGIATLHYYYEPFVHSDHLIRLPYSDAIEAAAQRGERHVSGLVLRYKELWGNQGPQSDVLTLNGTNVCNAAICPISKQVNGLFFFDRGMDGQTDLSRPDPAFSGLPFLSAVDIFLPAARPPAGKVSVSLRSRGAGPTRTLNFPNFPSTVDGAVLQFNDFEQPPAGSEPAASRSRCVPRRLAVSSRRVGPARLGAGLRAFARRYRATRRSRGLTRFCVRGGGRFAMGARRGRIDFIVTNAGGHRTRRHGPGRRLRGDRIAGARRLSRGLVVGHRQLRGRVVYGVRDERVRFIAVVSRRLLGRERTLVRRLRTAGVGH